MEKIMNKSNDVSTLNRPLADSELDAVSGGLAGLNTIIADAMADVVTAATDELQSGSGSPSPSWSGWPIGW
jgi:hypothetical protein